MMRHPAPICALTIVAALLAPGRVAAQQVSATTFDEVQFRYLAPPGNKTLVVAGVPGNSNVVYAGQPTGGVFKSTDGGFLWKPVFDNDRGIASVGALAVAPSNPDVVWVGTGESRIRSNVSIGDGVYKSTDAGATWTNVGLAATGRIARLAIHPKDPNIVFAAALGRGYAPQPERGIFRTRDGGKSWERVLFVDENTGGVDVIINPGNPQIVFAATWQFSLMPTGHEGGGPGSGIYRSRDGGTTWEHLTNGLPSGPLGRSALGMSASNPKRIYALLSRHDIGPWVEPSEIAKWKDAGLLWVSNDGGDTWIMKNKDAAIDLRPSYLSRIVVSPGNADELYLLSQTFYSSKDGGATFQPDPRLFPDNQDLWIDPVNPNRFIACNDRYVYFSENRGTAWRRLDLPNGQIYRVGVDNKIPYNVYGHRHDGTAYSGPSRSLRNSDFNFGTAITSEDWRSIGNGETGFSQPDPFDDNILWSTSAYIFDYVDQRTGFRRSAMPWPAAATWDPQPSKFRINGFAFWASVHRPRKIYAGSQFVSMSADMGVTWEIISPDLTAGNAWRRPTGPWADTNQPERSAIYAIAESPIVPGLIWTGSDDGVVSVTRDGGKNWTNVTANLPGVGPFGVVTSIEPSHTVVGTAYITVDRHKSDDTAPYVLKTTDYGASWRLIANGIPKTVVSYARVIREDPRRQGLLYLGTEGGLYFSVDDGGSWIPLHSRLPRVPVSGITVQENYNDLVVSTFGRGIWTLDDLGPIQEFTPAIGAAAVHLFSVRPTYLLRWSPRIGTHVLNETIDPPANAGQNPPGGTPISYYLKERSTGTVRIQILDDKGDVIRHLEGPGDAGIHRIWWQLDRDRAEGKPPAQREPIRPGQYKVKLSAAGVEQETAFVLRPDPGAQTGGQ